MPLQRSASPVRQGAAAPVETLLLGIGGSFALWTLGAQLAMLVGLSLRALAIGYSVAWLAGALAVTVTRLRARRRAPPRERPSVWPVTAVALLALLGGLASLAAIRPALDDANYAARAVYFLAHPDAPLDRALHGHALLDFPLVFPLLLTYTSELFWAYLAHLLGVPFLDVYHLAVPFVGGALIPLAWFLALHRFIRSPAAAVVGAAAVMAYLAIDGVSHQGFGNYAFVRIWHGKALLLSLVVPVFIAFALDWLDRPRPGAFAKLFVTGVCASGLSATALFLLPLLALCLGIAHIVSQGPSRRALATVVGLGASLAYLVGIGAFLWLTEEPSDYQFLGSAVAFPETFAGQLSFAFPGPVPLARVACLASLLACALLLPPPARRFLFGWLAAAVLLVLNPLMMTVVADHLTTYNTYWRLFYLLPFPFALGAAAAAAMDRLGPQPGRVAVASAGLLAVAGVANGVWPEATSFGGLPLRVPAYKFDRAMHLEARRIVTHASPGSMLAPHPLSMMIPLLSGAHPPASVANYFLMHFARLQGVPELAVSRVRAKEYLLRPVGGALPDVIRLLDEEGLPHVVVWRPRASAPTLRTALAARGFRRASTGPLHVLFTRDEAGPAGGATRP